jgi:hypothetical protein
MFACGAVGFWLGLLVAAAHVVMGWRVGVWLPSPKFAGLRKLRPRVELQSQTGQAERLGNGAETKRPPGHGNDTFVMSSAPEWKR